MYNIEYHLDGGTNDSRNVATFTYFDTITLYDATRAGYTFDGWYTDSSFTNAISTITSTTGDMDIFAKFTLITYNITYHMGSGETHSNPNTYDVENNITFTDALTEEEYYTFTGWYTDSSYTQPITSTSGYYADLDLYPLFEPEEFTITYVIDHGTNDSRNPDTITHFESITLYDAFPDDGYEFNGWDQSTIDYPTGPIEVYAYFAEITYTIDGDCIYTDGGMISYTYSVETVMYAGDIQADDIGGYVFEGWYLDSTYETPFVSTEGMTGDIYLYGKYEVEIYNICYDADCYTTIHNNESTFSVDDVVTFLPAEKDGYDFSHWEVTYYYYDEWSGSQEGYYNEQITTTSGIYADITVTPIFDAIFDVYEHTINGILRDRAVVEIPESIDGYTITHLDAGALSNSTLITTLYIPSTITNISGACGLTYGKTTLTSIIVDSNNMYYTSYYNGTTSDNVIVRLLDDVLIAGCSTSTIRSGITGIDSEAFYNCGMTGTITIPSSVGSIGSHAFSGNENMTGVTFASGTVLERIDVGAFNESGLTAITIPDTVTYIGDMAFNETAITSLHIPASVESIGAGITAGCLDLLTITVDPQNTTYDSRNNCNAIIETATNTLIAGCASTTFDSTIEHIGNGAFYGHTGLTVVNLEYIYTVGEYAFGECTNLDTIIVGSCLNNYYDTSLYNCTSLHTLVIKGNEDLYIGYTPDMMGDGVDIFQEIYVTKTTIDYVVTYLSMDNDYLNSSLYTKTLENIDSVDYYHYVRTNVQWYSIRYYMPDTQSTESLSFGWYDYWDKYSDISTPYYYVDGIVLTLPTSIQSIYGYGFAGWYTDGTYSTPITDTTGCSGTLEVYGLFMPIFYYTDNGDGNEITGLTTLGQTLSDIIIPDYIFNESTLQLDGIYIISSNAFNGCTNIVSVAMSDNIWLIGDDAFYNCSNMTSITLSDSLYAIGGTAFYGCSSLTSLSIPASVHSIGNAITAYCADLTTITVDSNNTYYDSRYDCNAIIDSSNDKLIAGCATTTIPDSVTRIGMGAFAGQPDLIIMNTGESTQFIEEYAFSDCENMTTMVIWSEMTGFANINMIDGCTSLDSMVLIGNVMLYTMYTPDYVGDMANIWNHVYIYKDFEDLMVANGNTNTYLNSALFTKTTATLESEQFYLYTATSGTWSPITYLFEFEVDGDTQTVSYTYAGEPPYSPWGMMPVLQGPYYYIDGSTTALPTTMAEFNGMAFTGWYTDNTYSTPITDTAGCVGGLTVYGKYEYIFTYSGDTITGLTALGATMTEINIPSHIDGVLIEIIGANAFDHNTTMETLVLADSISTTESFSFAYCSSLTTITVGAGLYYVDQTTLYGCTSLTTLILHNYGLFSSIDPNIDMTAVAIASLFDEIHVPNDIVNNYPNSYMNDTENFTATVNGDITIYEWVPASRPSFA